MTATQTEIMQILDMIPFFPDREKRDFMLHKVPNMTEEKQKSVLAELWETFKELMAQVPMNALLESDISPAVKKKIIQIEKKYLVELQQIEKNLRQEFLDAEKQIIIDDRKRAEELLHRQMP